jgi:hypothetical protein
MSILSSLTSHALNQLSTLVDRKEELVKEIERLESQMAGIISGKPVRATKGKPGRPAGKAKTARKSPKRGSRGNLGTKVLSALEAAGDAGVKVADLAEKLRVKGTNLHVWFGTTGKKNKAIKKVGKGHYRLQRK